MIALWEKTAELRLGLASVNSVLAWTMKKKRFLSIESPGLTVASTGYGHTNYLWPKLKSQSQINIWDVDIKAEFFLRKWVLIKVSISRKKIVEL